MITNSPFYIDGIPGFFEGGLGNFEVDEKTGTISFEMDSPLGPLSGAAEIDGEHHLSVSVNGVPLGETTFDGNFSRLRYHLGPIFGWAVNSKFRLGFSLMGIYDRDWYQQTGRRAMRAPSW